MQILPINLVDFNKNNFIRKNKSENESNLTFKTAAYRRVMAEAMEACCVSHEKEVISLFDRLLKAAVNMKDVVKVGESPIFHTRYSLHIAPQRAFCTAAHNTDFLNIGL